MIKNMVSGELSSDDPGFHLSAPWILVSKIDTRPQRVCITSRSRIMRCKLGSLNATYFRDLVTREGFRYYWWDNRISFNFGYDEDSRKAERIYKACEDTLSDVEDTFECDLYDLINEIQETFEC